MKALPRNRPAIRPSQDEIKGLEHALDKTYARLRERALADWKRHHRANDPADACVSVRITPAAKVNPELPARQKPAPRSLVAKPRKQRTKIPRTKGRRPA
jgi:hypothetical protein